MDKERAKSFMYTPEEGKKIYMSKNLQDLLDLSNNSLINIYAILETESGDTLCNMDWSYSGEPIIMDRFIHLEYYLDHYWFKEIIKL